MFERLNALAVQSISEGEIKSLSECQYARSGQRFDAGPKVSVVGRSPSSNLLSVETSPSSSWLASLSADAPAGGTAGLSSHAFTTHHVHTGAACFADWSDQCVWLIEGYDGWQSLC